MHVLYPLIFKAPKWVQSLTTTCHSSALCFPICYVLFYSAGGIQSNFSWAFISFFPCHVRVAYLSKCFETTLTFSLDNSISECLLTFCPRVSVNIWYFFKNWRQHYTVKTADTLDLPVFNSQWRRQRLSCMGRAAVYKAFWWIVCVYSTAEQRFCKSFP